MGNLIRFPDMRQSAQPMPRISTEPGRSTATEDAADVQAAIAGSRAAFSDLVRRHQKSVFFLCRRYVSDTDTASDLTQRAFIKAMQRLSDLREAATFRGWLMRIASNLCLNHLRDHARFVDEEAIAHMSIDADAHAQVESGERSAALRQAVAQLPTKQRMTLELRVYEDLSFRDIAVALGTSEGAAKVNYHYAVRKLRDLMGPKEKSEGDR